MKLYEPKDISQHNGKKFITKSGSIYNIQNRKLICPLSIELGKKGYKDIMLAYFGALPDKDFNIDELRIREALTREKLEKELEKLLSEKPDINLYHNGEGMYDILARPEKGLKLAAGFVTSHPNFGQNVYTLTTSRVEEII
jgi:hypothetical protein